MLLSDANRVEYTGVEDQGFYCRTVSEQIDPMVKKTYKQDLTKTEMNQDNSNGKLIILKQNSFRSLGRNSNKPAKPTTGI
jgi:hypothetical protein